jgi:hypothetical protein
MAIEPNSLIGRVQLVVGRVETLNDAGKFTIGRFSSLARKLESAISSLDRSDSNEARRSLESFVQGVNRLASRGTLRQQEASWLIMGADSILTELR